ncbi:MAG: glycosyltransferase [Candidatus Omnitrophica bacterium]|nr:glycosyltransferase [Candidatus Omnitrophota bacterium]
MSKEEILLSIIILCKNEEEHIEQCLSSVLNQSKSIENTEVLVIDCASSDKSIEKAEQFSVKIIQLKASWIHTASAGRFLGVINTRGRYIFIIDADMELIGDFLEKAVTFMEKDQTIAGVAGIGKEVHIVNGEKIRCIDNLYKRNTTQICNADYLGGAALFRRFCLEQAGSFNPYLYSQEELELCQRLKKRWKIKTLPYLMSVHYTYPYKSIKLFKRQLGSNRFTGMGQLLRYSFGTQFFWTNFSRFKKFVFSMIFIMVIIFNIPLLIIKNNSAFLAGVAIAIILPYLYLVIRKMSFKKALLTAIIWPCIIFNFAKGLFLKPKPAQDYPQDVKIIKR